ncbi:MAG TPA: hypothetical protein VFF04_07005 [Candidatus Babeliales bacterium]|nr:hypothetical protein [Candidatus Babeliales bacterium]
MKKLLVIALLGVSATAFANRYEMKDEEGPMTIREGYTASHKVYRTNASEQIIAETKEVIDKLNKVIKYASNMEDHNFIAVENIGRFIAFAVETLADIQEKNIEFADWYIENTHVSGNLIDQQKRALRSIERPFNTSARRTTEVNHELNKAIRKKY